MIRLSVDVRDEREFERVLQLLNDSVVARKHRELVAVPEYAAQDQHVDRHVVLTEPAFTIKAHEALELRRLVDEVNATIPDFDIRVSLGGSYGG